MSVLCTIASFRGYTFVAVARDSVFFFFYCFYCDRFNKEFNHFTVVIIFLGSEEILGFRSSSLFPLFLSSSLFPLFLSSLSNFLHFPYRGQPSSFLHGLLPKMRHPYTTNLSAKQEIEEAKLTRSWFITLFVALHWAHRLIIYLLFILWRPRTSKSVQKCLILSVGFSFAPRLTRLLNLVIFHVTDRREVSFCWHGFTISKSTLSENCECNNQEFLDIRI